MKFGACAVADAAGAILAHSVLAETRRIRKGTLLAAADISDLKAAGIKQITVAQLDSEDVHEDAAALQLATGPCQSKIS